MIRLAIVGLGAVVRNIHLPAYSQFKHNVTVVGGCDRDPAARDWVRNSGGISNVFDDLLPMIEKTKPHVVSVCTPPVLHREHALVALGCGCHVFCEKPIAEDLAQADEMIRAAERAGRWLVVNTQYPFMRIHAEAKRLIGSRAFGRLLYLHALQFLPHLPGQSWQAGSRRRVCSEMGVHVFELMRFFFEDDPVRICAHMPDPARLDADAVTAACLEFADGRAASMLLNRISRGRRDFLTCGSTANLPPFAPP